MRPLLIYGAIGAAVVVADQIIKQMVEAGMEMHEQIILLPFLSLFRTHNTGVAFSMFAGADDWRLIGLVVAVLAFIAWLAWKSAAHQWIARIGFALILGGAVGNLIDRATLGYVVDYVLFHTPTWSFAVFNLADAAITVGAGLVILQEVVDWRRGPPAQTTEEPKPDQQTVDPQPAAPHISTEPAKHAGKVMSETFRAILVSRNEDKSQSVDIVDMTEDELMEGDVTVAVEATTVNYKDGLAITGKSPVVRRWPMVPGIDFAGTVTASDHPDWHPGDNVVLNGWGVGETHYGAYAGRARVSGDWLVPLPDGMSAADTMAVGTAGYTAMLCVMALERHGVMPERGPVVVTGAAGGVGSVAVAVLAKLGYHVIASTGRASEAEYLKELGAAEIIDRAELSEPGKPLGKERWAGGVDAVGSHTLANVLAQTQYGGAVAACGLAQGMDLPASVAPFILRGVSLLGIDSVMAPKSLRVEAWKRIVNDLDHKKLAALSARIPFEGITEAAADIVEGKVRGRVVVEM